MGNKSLLELLQEEHKLCSRLQSVENMLDGLKGDDVDATVNLERHDALVHRLTEESAEIHEKLYPVRVAIGGKISTYSYLFELDTLERLKSPGEVTANA